MREGYSLKTYKNVLPQKRTVLLKYAGRPTPKNVIKWIRKTATDVKTPPFKGERRESVLIRDTRSSGFVQKEVRQHTNVMYKLLSKSVGIQWC